MRRFIPVVLAMVLLAGACRDPGLSSFEDLVAQMDDLELPESLMELGENYECPREPKCPLFVRWYASSATVESIRAEMIELFEGAGMTITKSTFPTPVVARRDEYVFFVVTHSKTIASNALAPPGTVAEISVTPLTPPE